MANAIKIDGFVVAKTDLRQSELHYVTTLTRKVIIQISVTKSKAKY